MITDLLLTCWYTYQDILGLYIQELKLSYPFLLPTCLSSLAFERSTALVSLPHPPMGNDHHYGCGCHWHIWLMWIYHNQHRCKTQTKRNHGVKNYARRASVDVFPFFKSSSLVFKLIVHNHSRNSHCSNYLSFNYMSTAERMFSNRWNFIVHNHQLRQSLPQLFVI